MTDIEERSIQAFLSTRHSGIILHPTSLPGEFGIGELGQDLYKFLDFLCESKQQLWQILPLGPTGYGNSPYQCFSTFAGNEMLISLQGLMKERLLLRDDFDNLVSLSKSRVDYGTLIPKKWNILRIAYDTFKKNKPSKLKYNFDQFKEKTRDWLNDYSLFMSIKLSRNFVAWNDWEDPLRLRDPKALANYEKENMEELEFHKFNQFLFFTQWESVKSYANKKGIKIIGDIPIFVAYDSVDVWAHPENYYLDENREMIYVAGVPPDYFSTTGQRWGNPLYNWNYLRKSGFNWWVERIRQALKRVDILRIDHFRGFESYWQIDSREETAVKGNWVKGPGIELFNILSENLGVLPIIAEDLGLITPEVEDLLRQTGFPGMRVLQFAFLDKSNNPSKNKFFPHNYDSNSIVYTGTHDNQTTKAWYEGASKDVQKLVLEYINSNNKDVVSDLIRLAWSSVANLAVIPLQDLLRLGDEARMNYPGKIGSNWEWRFTWNQIKREFREELIELNRLYGRNLTSF